MLSQFTKDVIVGMLLSDGHLEKRKEKINVNARLKFCLHNLEFVENLYQIFNNEGMVGANFRKYEHFDKRNNKSYTSYTFNTFVNPYLTETTCSVV
jgi:hypothetical protein